MINNRLPGGCVYGCQPQCNTCCMPCCPPRPGTGPTGPTGPQGERGPSASLVPFSIDSPTTIISDTTGNPGIINFAGFGGETNYNPIYLQPGDWASGVIQFTESMPYGASFITPNTGTLLSVSVMLANRISAFDLPPGIILRPFVCIATLPANSPQLVYTIIPETMTFTDPYVGSGVPIPKYSLRWGTLENLNIPLERGTAVGIILGMMSNDISTEHYLSVSISGSLYID